MTSRRLGWIVAGWAVLCLLASTKLGAMLGFMAGMALAMFGGAFGVLLQQALKFVGVQPTWAETGALLGWAAAALLGACLLALGFRAMKAFGRGDRLGARMQLSKAVHIIGACVAIGLSVRSLEAAWP